MSAFELSLFDYIFFLMTVIFGMYYYVTKPYKHWKNCGIKYLKPVPFFGNTVDFVLGKQNLMECLQELYWKLEGEPYGGIFMSRAPLLMIRDPNYINQVLVKDFSHFYNRGITVDENLDPLHANLINLEGTRWKSLRQKLQPAFSSGKLKSMHKQFKKCSDNLNNYFAQSITDNKLIEIRKAMVKFSLDVIGSCAFGLEFNSLQDPNSEFQKIGQEILLPTFELKLRVFLRLINDKLPSIVGLKTIKKKHDDFFTNLVKDTMNYREENKIERDDFIQILMRLKKQDALLNSQLSESEEEDQVILDDRLLVANTFIFFVAGFETTASTLTYALLELAMNQEIQEKLRNEVRSIKEKHSEISYDVLKEMEYLDCIVSETLRKYPVVGSMLRRCTKLYQLPGCNKTLNVGDRVLIPVFSIHHDPKHYPKPELFDPDRFTEENKNKRTPGVYLPFGDGPRICIGARFATVEIKIALINIILNYTMTVNEKTELPLKWKPRSFLLLPDNEIYLDFKQIAG